MESASKRIMDGQFYTKYLRTYDFVVLGIQSPFFWKCPTRRLVDLYDGRVTANHLDVGVGSGYFLDHCRFPSQTPRIVLMDIDLNSLAFTSRRIARYEPEAHIGNILEPISIDGPKFDSVGMNYLLHCVPGPMASKAVAFDHLKAWMNPGAVLFGATLLQEGTPRSRLTQRLMDLYNKKKIFSNREDSLDGLRRALDERFEDVFVEVAGCAAIFSGRA